MTTFRSLQSGDARRTRKSESADTFNFASQIPPSICSIMFTEHDKSDATIFKSLCKRTAVSKCFYRVEALPLVRTRFLRLANNSPKTARSPARQSARSPVRCLAALPHNVPATATAMPPDGRADDSQGNLRAPDANALCPRRKLARRLASNLNH